jgi:serine/threonine protein kinase
MKCPANFEHMALPVNRRGPTVRSRARIEQGLELGGRYRLDEPIGAGGMGDVWRGLDLRLRRPVAIKILPTDLAADQAAVERFRREAETTAGLQHPGITVTFDIDEHRDEQETLIFLVMELLTGRDLRTVLNQAPHGLPIELAVSLIAQAADALAAAHSRGIVHRDIKPANLFLLDDGRVKLCDFGIARLGDATQLTASGNFIGTPLYMAPEQFRAEPLDARSDLYSLGCVLYELLVGGPPFESVTNPAAIMYKHFNEAPVPPRSRRPDVPEHVERLTLALLAKDPAGRPPSASAVVASLRGAGAHQPSPRSGETTAGWASSTVVPHPSSGDAATHQDEAQETVGSPRPKRRRKGLFIGLAAAAVAVVAGGAAVLQWGPGTHKDPPGPTKSVVTPAPAKRSDTRPVVAGWNVTLAPQYGVAYDVPPTWKREAPDYAFYFEDAKENVLAGEKAVAGISEGKCARATTGLRGGSKPVLNPSQDQLNSLRNSASDEVRKWAAAAYGQASAHPSQPRLGAVTTGLITVNGINAARAYVAVTPNADGDPCTPPHAMVETVAMAPAPGSVNPVFFTVFADRGVPVQATDEEIKKVISSIRPYDCPAGTSAKDNNTCA